MRITQIESAEIGQLPFELFQVFPTVYTRIAMVYQ